MNDDALDGLTEAIRSIAHGDLHGPGGLEGLTMVIGGSPVDGTTLVDAVTAAGGEIRDGLSLVADALGDLAAAVRESRDAG